MEKQQESIHGCDQAAPPRRCREMPPPAKQNIKGGRALASSDRNDQPKDLHLYRLASVGQIAAGIAHEVRNPLTAVKGFLQLLSKERPHRYLDVAQTELENAIAILQNLLSVSKPDTEYEPMQRISLCVELEGVLGLFQNHSFRIQFVKDFRNAECEIYGKKNQLKKALFNLVKNAVEAIPDTGTITCRHYAEDGRVCVVLSDTGVGIPKEKLDLIGTPFFSTKDEGTGMGLAQVFSAIYQHGGNIEVSSEVGRGTAFTLRFPLDLTGEQGVMRLDLLHEKGIDLKRFLALNRRKFEDLLLQEASNAAHSIREADPQGEAGLLAGSRKLLELVAEPRTAELIELAGAEGERWAGRPPHLLAASLEWLQAFRKVLGDFICNYDRLRGDGGSREHYYCLERQMNGALDVYLRHFILGYNRRKETEARAALEAAGNLEPQRPADDLPVPPIPLSQALAVLPLAGTVDVRRAQAIQSRVFEWIGRLGVRKLIFDLSGAQFPTEEAIGRLFQVVAGIRFIGCVPIVAGVGPELADRMVNAGIRLDEAVVLAATVRQAVEELGLFARE
jgi:rsbT co-antagonist protein RsbR